MERESFSMPSNYKSRYDFTKTALKMCAENQTPWGVPPPALAALQTAFTPFETNYELTINRQTQSPAVTAARNAGWANVEPLVQALYNVHLLNNDAISITDKQILGILPINPGGKSPFTAPATIPLVVLLSEQITVLYVLFSDSATPASHAKPDGVAFCELRYKIGGDTPVSIDECPLNRFISRSHEAMFFEPTQRGKIIYVYARWVNRNSKTGPWSGLVTTVIP
jgi:hypothetical protein